MPVKWNYIHKDMVLIWSMKINITSATTTISITATTTQQQTYSSSWLSLCPQHKRLQRSLSSMFNEIKGNCWQCWRFTQGMISTPLCFTQGMPIQWKFTGYLRWVSGRICLKKVSAPFFTWLKILRPIFWSKNVFAQPQCCSLDWYECRVNRACFKRLVFAPFFFGKKNS